MLHPTKVTNFFSAASFDNSLRPDTIVRKRFFDEEIEAALSHAKRLFDVQMSGGRNENEIGPPLQSVFKAGEGLKVQFATE